MRRPHFMVGRGAFFKLGRGKTNVIHQEDYNQTQCRSVDSGCHPLAEVRHLHDTKLRKPKFLNLKL